MESQVDSTLHPQTKRHLRNEQKLRAAAVREFATHGLHGTKVSNIVAAAQLTQPTFYRTWSSKEAAYDEVITQTLECWEQVAEQIMAGPPTLKLERRLTSGVMRLYSTLTQDMALTRLVLQENSKNPDRYLPFIDIYTRAFVAAQREGHITASVPAESLAQMYTAVTERFFIARLYMGKQCITLAVKEVTQLLLPVFQPERVHPPLKEVPS